MFGLYVLLSVGLLVDAQYPEVKKCPKPPALENGRTRILYGGLRAEFQCNPGYLPVGTNYALCAEGAWTWHPPICISNACTELSPLEHGFMALSYGGGLVRYWCEDGYSLKGPALLVCDGKKWNGTQPNCVGKSGSIKWGKVGSSKIKGLHAHPRKHRKYDTWSRTHEELLADADYSCVEKHSAVAPPAVIHASPSTKWVVVSGHARLYTIYRCKWGYVAIGDSTTLYCKHKDWIGTRPKCIYKGLPEGPEAYPQADDWSSYGVNAHDVRVKSADYTCFKYNEGITAPDIEHATKIPRHKILDGLPHLYVEYLCYNGYYLDGPSEFLYCKQEKWHGEKPRCTWKGYTYGDDAHVPSVCESNNGGCSDVCTMVRNEAVCSCRTGLELNADGQTCGDIDECKTSNHGCAHICFNTHGSFKCVCKEGYFLGENGVSCYKLDAVKKDSVDDRIPPLVVFHHN